MRKLFYVLNVTIAVVWILLVLYHNLSAQENMIFHNLLSMSASITCDQSKGEKIIQVTRYDNKTLLIECVSPYIYYFPYLER